MSTTQKASSSLFLKVTNRPTVWLNGSGGAGKTRLQTKTITGKTRPFSSGEAAVRYTWCSATLVAPGSIMVAQSATIICFLGFCQRFGFVISG